MVFVDACRRTGKISPLCVHLENSAKNTRILLLHKTEDDGFIEIWCPYLPKDFSQLTAVTREVSHVVTLLGDRKWVLLLPMW